MVHLSVRYLLHTGKADVVGGKRFECLSNRFCKYVVLPTVEGWFPMTAGQQKPIIRLTRRGMERRIFEHFLLFLKRLF